MNIEKTISEQAVSDILTPMLESQDRIVTEDVAPLFDQATGLDTPPASGTVTTTIEESRSVITAIIRKAWTATLTMLGGASVIGYITAAYTYLRNRLQGNETYGIPDRRSEISASSPLAANLALLNDRKIGGVPDAADGMSLAQLLCSTSAASSVTEIVDDNTGWTANSQGALQRMMQIFTTCRDFTLNCKKVTANLESEFYNSSREYNIRFPQLTDVGDVRVIGQYYVDREPAFNVYLDALETTNQTSNTYSSFYARRIYIPNYKSGVYRQGGSGTASNPHTTYMLVGCKGAKTELVRVWSYYDQSSLVDFEISEGACMNITLGGFPNLTAENMYNHILCRLKQDEPNCGSGVTITLGSTNIAKLEAVDEYNTKLTELEDTYGYTFA